jgi:hypothetical protein
MTSSAVLSSRPPSSHFHFAPHHHHHRRRLRRRRRRPIPSSLSQTPVSLHPEPQQTQLSRSILATKLGKKLPKTKPIFFCEKNPTRSTDIPQASAFQRKMQSIEERIAGNDKRVQNAKASEE